MELEAKHLVPYLPYELKFGSGNQKYYEFVLSGIDFYTRTDIQIRTRGNRVYNISDIRVKPLLRPLSSLDTHELIVDLGGEVSDAIFDWCSYFNSDNQNKDAAILCAPFPVIEWCCKNHIDIFSLIDKGLAEAL